MTRQSGPALIWSPFASEAQAIEAAGALFDERLVACANILPPMRSMFVWNGVRGESRETAGSEPGR